MEPPITCDLSILNAELKAFCDDAPDLDKFVVDSKAFTAKAAFYFKMERHYQRKLKYAEDRIKQRADELAARVLVDLVEERIEP